MDVLAQSTDWGCFDIDWQAIASLVGLALVFVAAVSWIVGGLLLLSRHHRTAVVVSAVVVLTCALACLALAVVLFVNDVGGPGGCGGPPIDYTGAAAIGSAIALLLIAGGAVLLSQRSHCSRGRTTVLGPEG